MPRPIPLSEGGQTWEILLGDFTVKNGVPALTNVRVVGPPYGAYETQPWSPDGKGFLFFASGGYRSPFQATPPGWGNARVYYMRLYGKGASPAHPRGHADRRQRAASTRSRPCSPRT